MATEAENKGAPAATPKPAEADEGSPAEVSPGTSLPAAGAADAAAGEKRTSQRKSNADLATSTGKSNAELPVTKKKSGAELPVAKKKSGAELPVTTKKSNAELEAATSNTRSGGELPVTTRKSGAELEAATSNTRSGGELPVAKKKSGAELPVSRKKSNADLPAAPKASAADAEIARRRAKLEKRAPEPAKAEAKKPDSGDVPRAPAVPLKKPLKTARVEQAVFDPTKLTQEDLTLALLAIRHEFINLSELAYCFGQQLKAEQKGEGRPSLGEVLLHERYLTSQDVEYLAMVQSELDGPPTFKDIEKEFLKNVARIGKGADFGPYRILKEVGRGGMGVVFKAKDRETKEAVALKVLIGGEKSSVRDIERFKKEATVMRPLEHPNIVKILAVDREKGLDYIAMSYVRGESLKTLVQDDGPLAPTEALEVIRQVADAVEFIHGEGILHRDIKPDNIMLDRDGQAFLMDFGLAGWDKIEIIQGRGAIGTPMYQPPEQTDVGGPFGPISAASDVYGLGATLYYMLTGRHPFVGKTVPQIREKIRTTPVEAPRKVDPNIPPEAERICLKCLEKKQADRFAKPRELAAAIEAYLDKKDALREAGPGKPRKTGSGKTAVGKSSTKTGGLRPLASGAKKTSPKMRAVGNRSGVSDAELGPASRKRPAPTGMRAAARPIPPEYSGINIPVIAGLVVALIVAIGTAIWVAMR